jgi:cellulase/cellobiase CelA1
LERGQKGLGEQATDSAASDTIANIAKIEPAVADVPCTNILGLVIYDLPGRDCAAKASNGELKVGELSRYKSEYIDRERNPPRERLTVLDARY